jgi:hypothetical protein
MLSTRVKAFQKLDTNHDNLLTFEEWAVKTSERFKAVDRDGDGIISRDELNAFTRRRRRRRRSGLQPRRCSVRAALRLRRRKKIRRET